MKNWDNLPGETEMMDLTVPSDVNLQEEENLLDKETNQTSYMQRKFKLSNFSKTARMLASLGCLFMIFSR